MLAITALTCTLVACGNSESGNDTGATPTDGGNTTTAETPAAPAATNGVNVDDAEKGLTLVAQSDCLTCHAVEDRIVGPSYREIAAKYPANDSTFSYLAQKIIQGGAGVWGQVPMSAHPDMKEDDARLMAKYVMSLK